MHEECHLVPFCPGANKFGCKYSGAGMNCGEELPGEFWQETMTRECFFDRYKPLEKYGVFAAVPWNPNNAAKITDMTKYFGYVSQLSYVSLFETSNDIKTCAFICKEIDGCKRLVSLRSLEHGEQVSLFAPALPSSGLKMDVIEDRVKAVTLLSQQCWPH